MGVASKKVSLRTRTGNTESSPARSVSQSSDLAKCGLPNAMNKINIHKAGRFSAFVFITFSLNKLFISFLNEVFLALGIGDFRFNMLSIFNSDSEYGIRNGGKS